MPESRDRPCGGPTLGGVGFHENGPLEGQDQKLIGLCQFLGSLLNVNLHNISF